MAGDLSPQLRLGLNYEYEEMKHQESNKNMLIEKLFRLIDALDRELKGTRMDLQEVMDLKSLYHHQKQELATEKQELVAVVRSLQGEIAQTQAQNTFVSVLLDGDCMHFKDDLVQQAENGGHEAARLFKSKVEEYLKVTLELAHPPKILIRIYANMRGMAKAYKDAGVVADLATVELFIRGFNMENPLCDFNDAGNGKECSDEKIRENFKLHIADIHCKHIIFGGSADNGYARLLDSYSRDNNYSTRITMLEGPPFARELAALTDRLATTSFNSVFRTTKLEAVKPTFSTPQPPSSNSYSSIAATPSVPVRASSTPSVPPGLPAPSTTGKVMRNRKGQRVDPAIRPNDLDIKEIKPRKMCNNYHLVGYCAYGDNCGHTHGKKLSERQMAALRYIARTSPCGNGIYCELPNCVSGHRCSRDPDCDYGSNCRFPDEMHNVDTKVVDLRDVYVVK